MAIDYSSNSAILKQVYADKLDDSTFDCDMFAKRAEFVKRKATGNSFEQPVKLRNSHGFTYAAADAGVVTINDAITYVTKRASVKGTQIVGNELMSFDMAARADGKGPKAFVAVWDQTIDSLLQGHAQRRDEQSLYGSVGLGSVQAEADGTSTTAILTIEEGEFAAGIWAGATGRKVQFYRKDNNALVSSGTDSVFTVTSVNTVEHKITVTGTETGVTALESVDASPGVVIYEYGAKGNEQLGVHGILTTADKFGIDAGTYDLWAANTSNVSGALTTDKIDDAAAEAVNRGLRKDVVLWLNPKVWTSLAADMNAAARFMGGEKRRKNGQTVIEFLSQNGVIEIVPYNLIKQGYGYMLPMETVKRYGAVDLEFQSQDKGTGGVNNYFYRVANQTAYGINTYSNQATYIHTPSHCTLLTGITLGS